MLLDGLGIRRLPVRAISESTMLKMLIALRFQLLLILLFRGITLINDRLGSVYRTECTKLFLLLFPRLMEYFLILRLVPRQIRPRDSLSADCRLYCPDLLVPQNWRGYCFK